MYKIIYNNKVIEVIENPKFIRFLAKGHVGITSKSDAQGILSENSSTVYRFDYSAQTIRKNILDVKIEKVLTEEFRRLDYLLNSGKQPDADMSALSIAKRNKISALSEECNRQIISGISLVLSDNQIHQFKLTIEDQLNLLLLENQLNSGITTFVYHSTGEPCKVFNKEDMYKIISSTRSHIQYHTTYFNLLKQHVNTLVTSEEVQNIYYGIDVEKISTDNAMKTFLRTLK